MKTETKTAVAETAYGKKLDTPISYEYSWAAYENGPELVSSKDELNLDEQVKVRNNERQATARQKALTAALEAAGIVKPTYENDTQLALRDMYKILMASKKHTHESARAAAAANLGAEWED